jgi:hypothetical protein
MGEERSSAYSKESFFESVRAQGLPDPWRTSIENSLSVLLEDDDDGIVPDHRSFSALLKFIKDHPRWVAPGLTVNGQGTFVAFWEDPGVFRWSLAFLPIGVVEWTELEKSPKEGLVRRTGKGRAESIELPGQLRQRIAA